MVDVESKSIRHELPSSHWLKSTGQCVLERYLSATMQENKEVVNRTLCFPDSICASIGFYLWEIDTTANGSK